MKGSYKWFGAEVSALIRVWDLACGGQGPCKEGFLMVPVGVLKGSTRKEGVMGALENVQRYGCQ